MRSDTHLTGRIQRLFSEALHMEAPAPGVDLIDSGLLDSLALVELLHGLEQEFAFEIPFDGLDIESFRSVERIAGFVDTFAGRVTDAA